MSPGIEFSGEEWRNRMSRKSGAMTKRENGAKRCRHCGEPVRMKAFAGHIKACERQMAAAAKFKAKKDAKVNGGIVQPLVMNVGGQRFPVAGNLGNMI